MGCCLSSSSRDTGDPQYATGVTEENRPHASSRVLRSASNAIVSDRPSGSLAENTPRRRGTRSASRRRRRASNLPLSEHFNEPIRPHIWYSKRRTWTRTQLDQERREFFETRVTGRSEVWAALAAAISLMRSGDLTTAQSIIDAAGVTVPTGDLCEGCYDQQGALYRLPQCIVSDPENMIEGSSMDESANNDLDGDAMSAGKFAADEASGDELISDEAERRREEKGKTSERDLIKVRSRLSDGRCSDIVITVGKNQSVGFIARKIQQEAGISSPQRVRIAYLGKILKEHDSLLGQGWKNGHVVNAMVVTRGSIS